MIVEKNFNKLFILIIYPFFLITLSYGFLGEIVGGESIKSWASLSLLFKEFQIANFKSGIIGNILLSPVLLLDYKSAIIFFFFISHIFFCYASLRILSSFNIGKIKYLFIISSIPFIFLVEGPLRFIAISLLILHFSKWKKKNYFQSIFPKYLVLSIFFNWGYIIMLLVHLFITIFQSLKTIKLKKLNLIKFSKNNIFSFIILILILTLTFLQSTQSYKNYNNHWVQRDSYMPVKLDSSFSMMFMQVSTYLHSLRTLTESELKSEKAEWYFANDKAHGNCKNFLCVVKSKPKVIYDNFIFYNLKAFPVIFSQHFYNTSFIELLKPSLSKVNLNLIIFFIFILYLFYISYTAFKRIYYINNILFYSAFIGTASILLASLISLVSFRHLFMLTPIFYLIYSVSSSKKNFSFVSIILVLTFLNFIGITDKIFKNEINLVSPKLLKQEKNIQNNYFNLMNEIKNIDLNQKILTYESVWLYAFSNIKMNNLYNINYLPPFKSKKNKTEVEKFLDKIDIFIISNALTNDSPGMAGTPYLRYKLHIKDYVLKKKLKKKEIQNFGVIYFNK
ncbi:hypothetical protein N9S14_00865 [Candidatus Pelagibacter sp.]|nr:hypothetical protein [Candidatus Pelagibacter sp.]